MPSVGQSPFAYRGVVEGYYGPPFAHADRLWLLERMADWRMNTYVVAPKDDPLHRDRWREPYPSAALADFEALVRHGADRGVRVGFAIAPGLSIEYASEADRLALREKLDAFASLGARFFCLALDDVPSELVHAGDRECFASLAHAHVDLAHAVAKWLPADATLWLVPTDYAGTADSAYLETLGSELDADVEVGWTGRSVVSPEIRSDEAARRAACLGRRLLVWDNFPVNDGPMRNALHLGPYTGRDAGLADHLSGLLLNPMEHARASAVGLGAAAAWLEDPAGYDPELAWEASARASGEGAADAFVRFARGHRFGALSPDDRDAEVEASFEALVAALDGGAADPARAAIERLREQLDARKQAAEALREHLADRTLLAEIEPWIDSHATETRIMREAVDLLSVLVDGAPAMQVVLAFFRMEGRLTRIAPAARSSYGPRRHVYPQLASLEDEHAHFGDDPVLFLDRCLSDELVRKAETLALERLGGRPAAPLRG